MTDWMEELEHLGELRDKGLLTEKEFESERVKIISSATDTASPMAEKKPTKKGTSLSVKIAESTKFDKFFLCVWTLLSAGSGPILEALHREYPSEYEARLSASEALFNFGYPSGYPDDSIWCSALFLDVLFGGAIGLLLGLIVLKIFKWSVVKVNSLKSLLSENKVHEKVNQVN